MAFDYEALIIGGGPAGLSTALTLGRISRLALLCDDNQPRNAPSSHVNNFITRDGILPEEWRQHARKDLKKYPTIHTFPGRVTSVQRKEGGFQGFLEDGRTVTTKKLVLAYGIKDRMLDIPGFKELWGKSIFHCPFCHGFEIRGSNLGLILSHEMGFHSLPMIQSLSPTLTVFTNQKFQPTDEQRTLLGERKIQLVEDKIDHLNFEGHALKGVHLKNGQHVEKQFLFYSPEFPFELKSEIGAELGCSKNEFGLYQVNEMGATNVPGIFAAGDNMTMMQSVLLGAATGVKAGAGVIMELLQEQNTQ